MPWKVQQYSTTADIQGLASSEEAGRVTDGGGKGGGRWYSWRVISNRRRRADCDVIHTWCWWHTFCFPAGFNSIYPLEKNDPGLVWVVTLFLIIKDTVSLNCILNNCCNLCVLFYLLVRCLRNSASSNKENPLVTSCFVNLFCSLVTSSSRLSSSLLWVFSSDLHH